MKSTGGLMATFFTNFSGDLLLNWYTGALLLGDTLAALHGFFLTLLPCQVPTVLLWHTDAVELGDMLTVLQWDRGTSLLRNLQAALTWNLTTGLLGNLQAALRWNLTTGLLGNLLALL